MSKIKLGGYSQIDLSSDTIYNDLQEIKNLGKPVIVYDTYENTPYFADTLTGGEITTEIVDDEEITTYGDFTITKGGKTITITSANAVSSSGEIATSNILDLSKYYLTYDISSADDLNNANEITKADFDELMSIVENAQTNHKQLNYIVSGLYDDNSIKGLFVASNYIYEENRYFYTSYTDYADDQTRYVAIFTYNDKYYVANTLDSWFR